MDTPLEALLKKIARDIAHNFRDLKMTLDLETFKLRMQKALSKNMTAAYLAGKGGVKVSAKDLKGLYNLVAVQFAYLDNFVNVMQDAKSALGEVSSYQVIKDDKFWKPFEKRAQMYADSVVQPYWKGVVEPLPLPALPGDSSTLCGQRCRCKWDIKVLDAQKGDYDCYWVVDPQAEHCQGCKIRGVDWNPLRIRDFAIDSNFTVTFTERKKLKEEILAKLHSEFKGGKGSGNFGHAGRPGKVGGSAPKTGTLHSGLTNGFHGEVMLEDVKAKKLWMLYKGKVSSGYGTTHEELARGQFEVSEDALDARGILGFINNKPIIAIYDTFSPYSREKEKDMKYLIKQVEKNISKISKQFEGNVDPNEISFWISNTAGWTFHPLQGADFEHKEKKTTKGGAGSGHHGHQGRPGKVGGSTARYASLGTGDIEIDAQRGLKNAFNNKALQEADVATGTVKNAETLGLTAYVIAPDGKILYGAEDNWGGHPSHTQIYAYLAMKKKPDFVTDGDVLRAKITMADNNVEDEEMEKPFLNNGYTSIRYNGVYSSSEDPRGGDSYSIKTTHPINKSFIRKVIKWYENGKFPDGIKYLSFNNLDDGTYAMLPVDKLDLVSGFSPIRDKWGVTELHPILKEKHPLFENIISKLKGGAGSGNFGHAGRPGKVGGSSKTLTVGGSSKTLTVGELKMPKNIKIVPYAKFMNRGNLWDSFLILGDKVIDCGEGGHRGVADDIIKANNLENDSKDYPYQDVYLIKKFGAVKMSFAKTSNTIQTKEINTRELRRLQRLMDEGKISLKITREDGSPARVSWSGYKESVGRWVDVYAKVDEFMSAKHVDTESYSTPVLKQKREKGGAGSGHHGHQGRPGKVGGSTARTRTIPLEQIPQSFKFNHEEYGDGVEREYSFRQFDSYDEMIKDKSNEWENGIYSYLVLPSGKLLQTPKNVEHTEAAMALMQSDYHEILGDFDPKPVVAEMKRKGEMLGYLPFVWSPALQASITRVWVSTNKKAVGMQISTDELDRNHLRKIQKLMDSGVIPAYHKNKPIDVMWSSYEDYGTSQEVRTNTLEILTAKGVIDHGDQPAELKERVLDKLKGGKGSGNFGHLGRPGKVGGSAPKSWGGNVLNKNSGERLDKPKDLQPNFETKWAMQAPTVYDEFSFSRDVNEFANEGITGAYVVTPNDKIITHQNNQENSHTRLYAMIAMSADGTPKNIRGHAKGIFESYIIEDKVLEQNVMKTGDLMSVRFMSFPDPNSGIPQGFLSIHSSKPEVTTGLIKRINRLMDKGVIPSEGLLIDLAIQKIEIAPLSVKADFISGDSGSGRAYTFSVSDFASVAGIAQDGSIRYKESKLKGGPGSGNFGHRGRPGLVGGSRSGGISPARLSTAKEFLLANDGYSKGISNLEYWTSADYIESMGKYNQYTGQPVDTDITLYKGMNPSTGMGGEQFKITQEEAKVLLENVKKEYANKQADSYEKISRLYTNDVLNELRNVELQGKDGLSESEKWNRRQEILKELNDKVVSSIPDEYLVENYDFITGALNKRFDEWDKTVEGAGSWSYAGMNVLGTRADFAMLKAISAGKIDPQYAENRYGFRSIETSGREWKNLPETMYHATTDAEGIIKYGIKSRYELGWGSNAGLSGGPEFTISVGQKLDPVKNIERALHEAHMVATGKLTPPMMAELLRRNAGGAKNAMANVTLEWSGGLDDRVRRWEEAEDKIADAFSFYTSFARIRQISGGFEDPIFWATNIKALAQKNPANFKTLIYKPTRPTAKGYEVSSLSEIRIFGQEGIQLVEAKNFYNENDFNSIVGLPEGEVL